MLPRVTIPITDLKGKVDIQYWVLLLSHSLCLTPVLKAIRVAFFSIPLKCGPSEKYARHTTLQTVLVYCSEEQCVHCISRYGERKKTKQNNPPHRNRAVCTVKYGQARIFSYRWNKGLGSYMRTK